MRKSSSHARKGGIGSQNLKVNLEAFANFTKGLRVVLVLRWVQLLEVVPNFVPLLQTAPGHHRASGCLASWLHSRLLQDHVVFLFYLVVSVFRDSYGCFESFVSAQMKHFCTMTCLRLSRHSQLRPAEEYEYEVHRPSPSSGLRKPPPLSSSRSWSSGEPRLAYVCVVWGANAGYALGAAVLGKRLQARRVLVRKPCSGRRKTLVDGRSSKQRKASLTSVRVKQRLVGGC